MCRKIIVIYGKSSWKYISSRQTWRGGRSWEWEQTGYQGSPSSARIPSEITFIAFIPSEIHTFTILWHELCANKGNGETRAERHISHVQWITFACLQDDESSLMIAMNNSCQSMNKRWSSLPVWKCESVKVDQPGRPRCQPPPASSPPLPGFIRTWSRGWIWLQW